MSTPQIERLHAIKDLRALVAYLRDELDWPIETEDIEDLTFDYKPEEFGLDAAVAVRIKEIKQIRPLTGQQPWGIFWINFEKKRLPVVVMRRILRALVIKKRATAKAAERKAWLPSDLLFISAYGGETDRAITFAHFVEQQNNDLAELRVLGWDDDDTPLKYDYIAQTLSEKMRWQDDYGRDADSWRSNWRAAFTLRHREVITTSQELALELAALAKRIRGRIRSILRMEDGLGQMRKLMRAFQQGLIHDLKDDDFADMFAQTVTYGLFSIAVQRTFPGWGTAVTKDDVPNLIFTSPFLKEMLGVFLGLKSRKGKIDFDELGLADVTDLLQSPDTHMEAVLRDFGNRTQREDPVIHFYELFLTAYDKAKKIQRGVFYTPQPVVSYIVRSVHELLQSEFGLADGLADTATWGEMVKKNQNLKLPPLTDESGDKRTIDPQEPFVQILDPATGTGTFLVEAIDVIHKTLVSKWEKQGKSKTDVFKMWNEYVPKNLLPRLYGYELMMAPYAIAHMKLGLKLSETGYRFATEERARIYLTNSLEPKVTQLPHIAVEALAHEAAAVNEVKWYKRFTVVIGNPPYSNFGQLNRTQFLLELLEDYKRGLNEKKLNLDDDFIKFIRLGQYIIKQAGSGVLGLITNNVFLDGITHRQMRRSLREFFTTITVLDLHGSARKLETDREGGEENVFEIQQGVAVTVFSHPTVNAKPLLLHADMWGTRANKYDELEKTSVVSTDWASIESPPPQYFFVPKMFDTDDDYLGCPHMKEVFITSGNAIKTERDRVSIHFTREDAKAVIEEFRTKDAMFLKKSYDLEEDSRDWKLASAKADVRSNRSEKMFRPILYRPFDVRHTWYSGQTRGFIGTPAHPLMRHLIAGPNVAMACLRQTRRAETGTFLVGRGLIGKDIVSIFDIGTVFPLYLYDESPGLNFSAPGMEQSTDNRPNFTAAFLKNMAVVLHRTQEGIFGLPEGLSPEDIFHYMYAVFHSPTYRTRYAEFLKIDFPRLPLTSSLDLFRALAKLGGELVALHLLESSKLDKPITKWEGGKRPEVEKVSYTDGTVWIDKAQTEGFEGVPEEVWNFHIGGYQVCEKWLKDRKGRTLTKDDLTHYQKIVVALRETIRLMAEIDNVIEKYGGWPGAFQAAKT